MTTMTTKLSSTALALALMSVPTDSYAVDVALGGIMSKAIMSYNDGQTSETNFVDNDKMISRFWFKGDQKLENGMTAGVMFMHQSQSTPSNAITQGAVGNTTPASSNGTPVELFSRVSLGGDWGVLALGNQGTATNGITEQDIAGVNDVMGSAIDRFGGGLKLRQKNSQNFVDLDGNASSDTLSSFFDNFDGAAARSHGDFMSSARYTSPVFNGFQGSVSAAQGGTVDATVTYKGKVDKVQIQGGLGYVAFNSEPSKVNDVRDSSIAGSISAKHDNGVAVTLAGGQESIDNQTAGNTEPQFYYVKTAYNWDSFQVAADYGKYDNMNIDTVTDHEATAYGLGGQYNMGHGVALSAMYRNMSVDIAGTDTDDVDVYLTNLSVKF